VRTYQVETGREVNWRIGARIGEVPHSGACRHGLRKSIHRSFLDRSVIDVMQTNGQRPTS
jgi:hypothetical protein